MQQYFLQQQLQLQTIVEMDKEQSHHIAHVMRMKENEQIRLADMEGHMYFAHVLFQDGKVYAHVDEAIVDATKTPVEITLAQGLIKKEKWDFLLQKSAELGVARLLPFMSSRTIVKSKDEKLEKKLQRWNKILQEACEQCKRSTLVELHAPVSFTQLIRESQDADVRLIAYENADVQSAHLKDILKAYPHAKKVFVIVGSEGGFSEEEVACMEAAGFQRVSLGSRILRAETAAMVLVNSISFYYELAGDAYEDIATAR